ncbi:AmpE protein [Thiogranum longum]|uniref:AmpE protein n=1 Tax=Thiogranum longum TaxID=1537524 RepID=A0A4R1HG91_9GAMM|nr:regulatory signaling modulator protein AmpE [Thiogranum longum]TCK19280.1 AmpE protein [Thiogranum longum]
MTLISAILGIIADRLLTHLHEYRHYRQFLAWVDAVHSRFSGGLWDGIAGVMLVLLPVWVLTALLQVWLHDMLFGLIGLLFYVGTFVYCLGPRDLAIDVNTYCEVADSTDEELRARAAARLLGDEALAGDDSDERRIARAVLIEANDRLFAVLFWFVLLGPVGAVMYRSVVVMYRECREPGDYGDAIEWAYSVLVWIPARLLALGYALSGHFDAAIEGWRAAHREIPRGSEGSCDVLAFTGEGALGLSDESTVIEGVASPVRAAMRLVWRTLTIWVVVLSLLTLAGWSG